MLASLCVPDHIVIGFFTAVILGLCSAVLALYMDRTKDKKE